MLNLKTTKMKTFQQNNITYLAVEVPDGATVFEKIFDVELDEYCVIAFNDEEHHIRVCDYCNFEIIGLLSLITEEQAKEMVPKSDDLKFHDKPCYYDFIRQGFYTSLSATNSLKSRLRSLGFTNENILIIKQLT